MCDLSTDASHPACEQSGRACAIPVSKQCPIVYGASSDPRSVRIGAVFDLSGPEAAVGAMQAHSSELAVEQINAAGGVKLRAESDARRLTLIICDRALGVHESVSTLASKLDVKAMIGPARSQLFAEVASDVAIPDDVLLLGPSALSGAVRGARGNKLTWGMTLSEADRVPLLLWQLRALASQLDMQPRPLELALVMRADGPMTSVRISQAQIAPNDHAPAVDLQLASVAYEYADDAQLADVVERLASQQPDIVITDGAAEVADKLIGPLEQRLSGGATRPHYLLSEAAQDPQLLQLVDAQPALQARVSVIGAVPTEAAQPVYEQFERAYRERYASGPSAITGVAASYAAVYALGFAMMSADDPLRYGDALALGFRQLAGGGLALTTAPDAVSKLSDAVAAGQSVTVTGPLSELGWTEQGGPRGALVGVYCLGRSDGHFEFVKTDYAYNSASGALQGTSTPCAQWLDAAPGTGRTRGSAASDTNVGSGKQPARANAMDAGADMSSQPAQARDARPQDPQNSQEPQDAGQPAADSGAATQTEPMDIGMVVQYFALNAAPNDSVVGTAIKILNRSASEPIPLCSLKARYYLTNEHADACPQDCVIDSFYSGLQPSGMMTTAQRSYHEAGPESPSAYLEISFPCGRIMLGMGDSVELQQGFHTEPYRDFDQTNDYSFRPFPMTYTDSDRLTLYRDGKLVWGKPPR